MSQHDLTIDNQGFPAFRADLNNALQALGSTQSGTSAPSPTFANQLWYDTTNNQLKIRNEDNDAWITLFTLDQVADAVSTITGSTINAGALTASGNVSFDGGTFVFNDSGADRDFRIEGDTNANLFFTDASTDRVGINTNAPSAKLDIRHTSFTPTSTIGSVLVEESTAWSQGIQVYINNAGTFASSRPSGAIGSSNTYNLFLTGGSIITNDPDGGNGYTASATAASAYRVGSGIHSWFGNIGLTAGNTFTATERMRLNTTGNLILQGGTVTANGVGLTFPATQSASSDANCLDDYEEGTWTPSVFSTVGFGGSVTVNLATYTKIGRIVTICLDMTFASASGNVTAGDKVILSGLPFSTTKTTYVSGRIALSDDAGGIMETNVGQGNVNIRNTVHSVRNTVARNLCSVAVNVVYEV